jgi:peptidoglycan/LPS O-acetylase OafA/YrhL
MVANIQVLRNFAALAVVWHHLQQQLNLYLGAGYDTWFGIAGVDVFFVISGFIMFHTNPTLRHSPVGFWIDRIIRIAPLYWIATLIVVAMVLVGLNPQGAKSIDSGDVLTSLGFFPDVRADGYPSPILTVGWTLIYEMFFYLTFGLSFFLRSRLTALLVLSVFFAALSLLSEFGQNLPYAITYYMQPITLEFVAGGALAIAYTHVKTLPRRTAQVLGYGLIFVGVWGVFIAADRVGELVNSKFDLRVLTMGVASVAIVAGALALDRGGISPRNPKLMLMGAASYAVYLFHPVIVQFATKALAMVVPLHGEDGLILLAGAGFGSATILGVMIHLWVELPMQRYLKGVTSRLRAAYRRRYPYPPCKPKLLEFKPSNQKQRGDAARVQVRARHLRSLR